MKIKTNLPKAVVYREPEPGHSKDLNFTPNALSTSEDLVQVVYGGGYFVAIGKNGTVAYSEKGQTWVTKKLGDYTFNDITYAQEKYVIVGKSGRNGLTLHSEDLIDWVVNDSIQPLNAKRKAELFGVMFNGEAFVTYCYETKDGSPNDYDYDNYLYACTTSDLFDISRVLYKKLDSRPDFNVKTTRGNNRLIIFGFHYGVDYTTNGREVYESGFIQNRGPLSVVFFCHGQFFATYGLNYYTSVNAKDWEPIVWGIGDNLKPSFKAALRISDFTLYIGGMYGLVVKDGEKLTEKTINDCFQVTVGDVINTAVSNEKSAICVGNGGVVFYSTLENGDNNLVIEPSLMQQEIYLKKSDNVRTLNVKAVTPAIDSNIKPENIKEGVKILGVTGTCKN